MRVKLMVKLLEQDWSSTEGTHTFITLYLLPRSRPFCNLTFYLPKVVGFFQIGNVIFKCRFAKDENFCKMSAWYI